MSAQNKINLYYKRSKVCFLHTEFLLTYWDSCLLLHTHTQANICSKGRLHAISKIGTFEQSFKDD